MKVGALVAGDLALGLLIYVDTQHELHDTFRIPRTSTASSSGPGKVLPRARSSSRFVPYTRGKANSK